MRVYTELVSGHMVDKPAPGKFNSYRKCSPYPFAGEVAMQSPTYDFILSLEGFSKVHAFPIGEPQAVDRGWCGTAMAAHCSLPCCAPP